MFWDFSNEIEMVRLAKKQNVTKIHNLNISYLWRVFDGQEACLKWSNATEVARGGIERRVYNYVRHNIQNIHVEYFNTRTTNQIYLKHNKSDY